MLSRAGYLCAILKRTNHPNDRLALSVWTGLYQRYPTGYSFTEF